MNGKNSSPLSSCSFLIVLLVSSVFSYFVYAQTAHQTSAAPGTESVSAPSPSSSLAPAPSSSDLPSLPPLTSTSTTTSLSINPTKAETSSALIPEDRINLRDPFRMSDISLEQLRSRSPLELQPLDSFKMIGVLTGPDQIKAMLRGMNGRAYIVTEKMKIGFNGGFIRKITPDGILVREKTTNVLGQVENMDVEIPLMSESGPESLNK